MNTRNVLLATCMACFATASVAENPPGLTTQDEVRAEVSEAMAIIAGYAAQERDAALTEARSALDQLDAAIEAREQDLRDNWSGMSAEAQEIARSQMRELRTARNALGERYGALQAGSVNAWTELKDGFADAWSAFSEAGDRAASEEGQTG
jgi:hypothetical protein